MRNAETPECWTQVCVHIIIIIYMDIAIRKMAMEPTIYNAEDKGTYNPYFPYDQGYSPLEGFQEDYIVNFESQVKPIIDRMAEYRWVTEIP